MKNLNEYGIQFPDILLPKEMDLKTWAVIACDQYTQDFDYWKNVEEITDGKISSLNLIFPEVYLEDGNTDERINKIHSSMKNYLDSKIFEEYKSKCIYIERKTEFGRTRKGLVLAVDLEKYDWHAEEKAMIRATEATVPERIPPRVKIRNGAPLELPHIMLLVNDSERLLVEGAGNIARRNAPVYKGELMENSGSITGWALNGEESETENLIKTAIEKIIVKNTPASEKTDKKPFLFAVGDGNHSLASAKAVWEEFKKTLSQEECENSPVRYALVEVVNIYDEGLTFEPIHRVLFDLDAEEILTFVQKKLGGTVKVFEEETSLSKFVTEKNTKGARYGFIFTKNGRTEYKVLETEIKDMAISALQPVLDTFMSDCHAKKTQIDYIHGTEDVLALGKTDGNTAILLPPVEKDSFFATIESRGPLPRKSFSMGEASEKRFYVEARKLFG